MTELQVEPHPSSAASEPQPHYLYTLHHAGIRNGAALFVGITNDPDRTAGRHQRRAQCGSLVLEILSLVDTPRAERPDVPRDASPQPPPSDSPPPPFTLFVTITGGTYDS